MQYGGLVPELMLFVFSIFTWGPSRVHDRFNRIQTNLNDTALILIRFKKI